MRLLPTIILLAIAIFAMVSCSPREQKKSTTETSGLVNEQSPEPSHIQSTSSSDLSSNDQDFEKKGDDTFSKIISKTELPEPIPEPADHSSTPDELPQFVEAAEESVSLVIDDSSFGYSVDRTKIIFTGEIINNSSLKVNDASNYQIEQYVDNEWKPLELADNNTDSTPYFRVILPGDKLRSTYELSLGHYKTEIKKGLYRITKKDWIGVDEELKYITLSDSFELTEELLVGLK